MPLVNEYRNYYEKLLFEHFEAEGLYRKDSDYLADLCCIALNNLPPKYVRHDVDTAFFLTRAERANMNLKVSKAVQEAIEFLDQVNDRD
ncbi:late competence development ComFB family protein [Marinomonas ostreistagni]|uniref:late competence development ComFB family protein n=1 Tax=Marinomonas ostreistagni TaxID=359209 RepID=UPI001950BBAF|nr:late competence development ComFB family protein [Marinomonas ostreistagni]MBM6550160.1 late competence development ComFB family protein [Marinomonas ostreistagni]